MATFTPRVFSGIQPSGDLHLGNYLGAIRRFVPLQGRTSASTASSTCTRSPCGRSPRTSSAGRARWRPPSSRPGSIPTRSILFNQSQVAEHAELAWIFNASPAWAGWTRMTQFKDKAGENSENGCRSVCSPIPR